MSRNTDCFDTNTYRHTNISRLVAGGVDLRTVMEWAGHSDMSTTQKYSHFIPRKMVGAAQRLHEALIEEVQDVQEEMEDRVAVQSGLRIVRSDNQLT